MNIEKLEEIVTRIRSGDVQNADEAADLIEDAIGDFERIVTTEKGYSSESVNFRFDNAVCHW